MLEIVKVCNIHGDLTADKAYYRKNRNQYECRECMRASEKKRPKREYTGAFAEYHRAHAKEWRRENADAVNEKIREDRKNNPEKYREWEGNKRYQDVDKSRYREVLKKHGITSKDYDEAFEKQNGLCAICHKEETRLSRNGVTLTRLCLDHCHTCEDNGHKGLPLIRGFLCHSCNVMIRSPNDNIAILESAIQYLKQHEHIKDDSTGVIHE